MPEDHPDIVLVSTYTRDRVPLQSGGFEEQPGGPAHYIGEALRRLGRSHRVITGDLARVTVIRGADGDEYIIHPLPQISLPARFDGSAVILSPIMGEIDPLTVPPVDALLVVDVQGFVREPDLPTGESRRTFDLRELVRRADIVKASVVELERLNATTRAALDETCLLITLGAKGARVRQHGGETRIDARPVRTNHTIGAGDTFLAAFVSAVMQGDDPLEAANSAARFTEMILTERVASSAGS